MPTPLIPQEQAFFQLVTLNDKAAVATFLQNNPALNVNYTDSYTGRTALHLAQDQEMHDLLVNKGFNKNALDKGGFTPFELMLNPYEYQEALHKDGYAVQRRYYQFYIDKINEGLSADRRLIYLDKIEQINPIIKANDKLTRIAFLVKKPNCLRTLGQYGEQPVNRDFHISLIYFERCDNNERFIQLDSLPDGLYILPADPTSNKVRVQYYSPYTRQSFSGGSFEDAISLASKLMKLNYADLSSFCAANSQRDTTLNKPLSITEIKDSKALQLKLFNSTVTDEETPIFAPLLIRYNYEKLKKFYNYSGLTAIQTVLMLTSLPPVVLLHINFYSTMRDFRVNKPSLFNIRFGMGIDSPSLLDIILEKGTRRTSNLSKDIIRHNIANPDPVYDFKSVDFAKKESKYQRRYKKIDHSMFKMFSSNLQTLVRNKHAKLPPEKLAATARLITSYVTGSEDNTYDSVIKTPRR